MDILPAIDLLGGRCGRLLQGDYDQAETFYDDPAIAAAQWLNAGTRWLHLVDLDGAKAGELTNLPAIEAIAQAAQPKGVSIQVGGGVRSRDRISQLLDLGVSRVIVGTVAVEQPDKVANWCSEFPGQVVIGIDARDGRVATRGWLETSTVMADDLAQRMGDLGAAAIIYTDIQRDGTLKGPNLKALRTLAGKINTPVIASGGVSSMGDLLSLLGVAPLGVSGVIIGKALYTGNLDLSEAIKAIGPGRLQDIPPDLPSTRWG